MPIAELSENHLDLSRPHHVHVIGMGGAGMSAIAEVLIGTGHTVSGSDQQSSQSLDRLAEAGAQIHVGHNPANVSSADIVVHSTAIPATNPEIVEAKRRNIPVLRRAEILSVLSRSWTTVAVAGTHGKTTTSAMLTTALMGAGLDPAFIVGGNLTDLGRGAAVGSGKILVVEADESDGTFVELDATGVIVTNVEPDHLEHYGGFAGLESAFVQFVSQADGPKVICVDDPGSARLAEGRDVVTYGTSENADWRITNPRPTPTGITISVDGPGGQVELILRQPGMHNARNATAALAMATELGADLSRAAAALSEFGGVGRRFEDRGSVSGASLVDDYAHLPTEVSSALAAGRSLSPERVVAVFQPHRYSRTEQLWSSFSDCFGDADVLIVTGIYPSGEAPRPGITGELVANAVRSANPDADIRYIEELDDVVNELGRELRQGDLCMTLGAGDLTSVPDLVIERFGGTTT